MSKPTGRAVAKDYESYNEIANFLRSKIKEPPVVGLVCGSGLGGLGEKLEATFSIPYADIPGFPVSSVAGHQGILLYGTIGGKKALCMQGRFHGYEGYSPAECATPIRVMHLMGVKTLILTAASGALNPEFKVGDMMVLSDHICLAALVGNSPLTGPNDERFGPRFPVMQGTYTASLREAFQNAAASANLSSRVRQGVYGMIGGPAFATDTEAKFLRSAGADVVGMSVVWEATAAHHCGMKVLAVVAVTDVIDDYSDKATLHDQVVAMSKRIVTDMFPLLETVCKSI